MGSVAAPALSSAVANPFNGHHSSDVDLAEVFRASRLGVPILGPPLWADVLVPGFSSAGPLATQVAPYGNTKMIPTAPYGNTKADFASMIPTLSHCCPASMIPTHCCPASMVPTHLSGVETVAAPTLAEVLRASRLGVPILGSLLWADTLLPGFSNTGPSSAPVAPCGNTKAAFAAPKKRTGNADGRPVPAGLVIFWSCLDFDICHARNQGYGSG